MENALMKLAATSYWQSRYRAAKEGLTKLYYNEFDLSNPQTEFLYYLRIYEICYEELGTKEYPFLDEKLISDPVRVKAFMYWRKQYIEKKIKESKNPSTPKKQAKTQFKIYNGPRPDKKKEVEGVD